MPNRENVIRTLDEIKTQTAGIGLDSAVIAHEFIDKIIDLLKGQEAVAPSTSHHLFICPVCKTTLKREQKFCHECGQEVKWE